MLERQWLVLAHAYVSVAEYTKLNAQLGGIDVIVRQSRAQLMATGLSETKAAKIASPDMKAVDAALAWLEHDRHSIVSVGSTTYPEMLTQLHGNPLLLFVNGDVEALHLPALAIVGSRNPTEGGLRNATDFSKFLAASGFTIVSGLAEGIDAAAHTGALDSGGTTVAFLGHGIDRIYPAKNRDLAHRIVESGALVSEYPLGAAPDKRHFPERNRLISGLSLGTLVVEAARRSGSLITARLAAEQGREVFALPGSIHNPLARGCHELIRQGAKLVETAHDIAAELRPLTQHVEAQNTSSPLESPLSTDSSLDDDEYVLLRKMLSHDPVSIDDLHSQSGLTIEQLSSMLLILELHGEVESLSGGRYARIA